MQLGPWAVWICGGGCAGALATREAKICFTACHDTVGEMRHSTTGLSTSSPASWEERRAVAREGAGLHVPYTSPKTIAWRPSASPAHAHRRALEARQSWSAAHWRSKLAQPPPTSKNGVCHHVLAVLAPGHTNSAQEMLKLWRQLGSVASGAIYGEGHVMLERTQTSIAYLAQL
eukprot:scaffold2315_cov145-Isochrysis_galbana.AAC.3